MTIHILEYIRLPKDLPKSNSLTDNRELIPNGLNMLDYGNEFRMSQRV